MNGAATLVTGGCGFIGSALVRRLHKETSGQIVVVDALTYAGSLKNIDDVHDDRLEFYQCDVRNQREIARIIEQHRPSCIFHLAAETHVDRSIDGPRNFVDTNVMGTLSILEAIRAVGVPDGFKFIHVSTDEVFGELGNGGCFQESAPYRPRSPYAASKAASDHLVAAWQSTYGLPAVIVNLCNNYGSRQFSEKLIPLLTIRGIRRQAMPIYGEGLQVREWLHVDDSTAALFVLAERAPPGSRYNVGSGLEMRNIDVAVAVAALLDQIVANGESSHRDLITFVEDRPGHDFRYALDSSKILEDFDWAPKIAFEVGLRQTVHWFVENYPWARGGASALDNTERLGLLEK